MRRPDEMAEAWRVALGAWLESPSEATRAAAYELGRSALAEGLGLVALSELHARTVERVLQDPGRWGEAQVVVERAWRFLAEALAPSDLALRGYRDAVGELQRLNRSLEDRVEQRSRALLSAEHRYRTLVEQLPVVTYTASTRASDRMSFVSPQIESVTGHAPAEWLELPGRWGGCIHEDDRERVHAELGRSAREGSHFRAEYRIVRKDGRIAWVRDEARLDHRANGEVLHQGVWLDVTGMRALEDGLRQAQKLDAIGRLAGGVAHDFNNVLTAILSFSRFVQEDLGKAHPSAPDVEEVIRSAERGASLTRQLLAFSRSRAFEARPVDPNAVVTGMQRMLQRLLGERIQLEIAPGSEIHQVHADPSHLEQLVLNLVVNAGDAIAGPGRVRVRTRNVVLDADTPRGRLGARPGEYVMLAVSDTGAGMDPETQRRLFEPFYTTKDAGKGTGLGLATVYGILRQTGGDVEVESEPGRGSTFRVFLPRSFEDEEAVVGEAPERTAPGGGETLLLVEDDPAVRSVAVRALRESGFGVLEAAAPDQALAFARNPGQEIHVVLTDMVLGHVLGTQLAVEIAAIRPEVRVLYMSGYAEADLLRHGVTGEALVVLEKPFSPSRLTQFVRDALDGPPPRKP